MRELIAAYRDHLAELGRAAGTREAAAYWLETFARFCEERGLDLADLAPPALAAYHTRLLWEPHRAGRLYAPASVDMALRLVRAFLRWAVSEGALARDPARHLVLGRPPSRPRPTWSPAELEALLARPDPTTPIGLRDRALLALYLTAGLTGAQLSRLELADYDAQSYRLAAHRGHRRRGPRELVLSDDQAELLSRYLAEGRPRQNPPAHEQALFLTCTGQRCDNPQPWHILRRYWPPAAPAASSFNRPL